MTRIFILWNESYSVGIDVIDAQHKELLDIINSLYESFVDQTTGYKITSITQELIDYCDYHFKTEEELFIKYEYPDKDAHIAKHQVFIDKINEFNKQLLEGSTSLTFQLMNFLRNWLLVHIKGDDQEYAALYRGKGIN
jgi:hemerythrin-like metal-binding protein